MINPPNRYLVTSALPYANGPLHIGHLAGAYLPADAFVRFLRLSGKDVAYIGGSDEHGAAIKIKALKEGTTPQKIVDKYHSLIKETFKEIGISFDIYHRTTEPIHHETSQDFFLTLYKNGAFTELESEQYYDEDAGQFLADRFIVGTCPRCNHPEAYGDQCENCGSTLSPTELIDPKSTISGSTPVLRKTKHWYLPLEQHESWLRTYITEGKLDGKEHHYPEEWKKHVVGQCKSWLDAGLQPRSITRDLDWGVDVPQEIEGSKGKKLYVWMDAPIGYVSATKEWAKQHNKDWELYWKDEESALIHFIGKDNIVFHCLIFPVILKSYGGFNLPVNVPANQFVNLEGQKVSTSKGWAVWIHEYLKDFPSKKDELRYYGFKIMPELKDSDFTWKGFQEAVNNELVNNLGNFIHRVLVLTNKYYNGVVPVFDESISINAPQESGLPTWHDSELLDLFDRLHEFRSHIKAFDFRSALKIVMEISTAGNQLLQYNEPWKQEKTDPDLVKVVMNLGLQYVTALSVAIRPFMPFTSDRLRDLLALPPVQEKGEFVDLMDALSEGKHLISGGHKIKKAQHLFTKVSDEEIQQQIDKLMQSSPEPEEVKEKAPVKEAASFDDFSKLDLRTGTITAAEKVEKADKLLKLTVDLGFEQRTVVSGIAGSFDPKSIIGQNIVLVANLQPRKIRGILSQGMILMAENKEGKLGFVGAPEGWTKGDIVR
ncbi:MAG: methionine--tRNA ligase [Saprospiraceae bacterium]|nr:methionine--tRNA ligase [Saprospiraceae bacterium]